MPRRREIAKRAVTPDPKYNNPLVAKFINNLMKCGKKSVAESILYGAFAIVEQRTKDAPIAVFEKALENVKPLLEVKSRRVGGATYQVPVEVAPSRKLALGIRWLISHARERAEKTMKEKLA
ncbi:MAG: 30S ribosomal protein S7, partial [Deltaproteobacteria bacterium]|nr:30S ribosomal protein S7 [Deltaproteobacteria bacterium]